MAITSRKITDVIVCIAKRGQSESFNREELVNCHEIFGTTILKQLFEQTENLKWIQSKTCDRAIPKPKPRLHAEFMVPEPIRYKRKWYLMKIIG